MTDHPVRGSLDGLPEWNLADLYPLPESPALAADLDRAERDARAFGKRWKGRLAAADGRAFGRAIASYEAILELAARAESYASLLRAGDLSDPEIGKFNQAVRERVTAITGELLFFTLEINRIEDDELEEKLTDPPAARYRPWLRDIRLSRGHQLSEEAERLLHVKHLTGRQAWRRLFDETMADLRFPSVVPS